MSRFSTLTQVALCLGVAILPAAAQGTAPPAGKPHRRATTSPAKPPKTHIRTAAPSNSLEQLRRNLIDGSPEQQDMERRDNDLAGVHPIDHSKDEFGSDAKGFR